MSRVMLVPNPHMARAIRKAYTMLAPHHCMALSVKMLCDVMSFNYAPYGTISKMAHNTRYPDPEYAVPDLKQYTKVCAECGKTRIRDRFPCDFDAPDGTGTVCIYCGSKMAMGGERTEPKTKPVPPERREYFCPVCESGLHSDYIKDRRRYGQPFQSQAEADDCCRCDTCGELAPDCKCHDQCWANREGVESQAASWWKYLLPRGATNKVRSGIGAYQVY